MWLKGYRWQFKHHSSKRKAQRVSGKAFLLVLQNAELKQNTLTYIGKK